MRWAKSTPIKRINSLVDLNNCFIKPYPLPLRKNQSTSFSRDESHSTFFRYPGPLRTGDHQLWSQEDSFLLGSACPGFSGVIHRPSEQCPYLQYPLTALEGFVLGRPLPRSRSYQHTLPKLRGFR